MTDEFKEIDAAFGHAFVTVQNCAWKGLPVTDDVEEAVDMMFDIAFQQADPSMLKACVSVCFDHFISKKRSPPWAALEYMKDAFRRWQTPEAPSLNAAFGITQVGPGARSRWDDRVRMRANFVWMDLLTDDSIPEKLSIDDAAEVVEDVWSAKDMKRSYSNHRRKVKSTNSE